MEHYAEAGNEDRLYDEELALLQREEFDVTLAGIRLLGRDMAYMAATETGKTIKAILETETGAQQPHRLVQDMAKGMRIHDRHDVVLAELEKLKIGFTESLPGKETA